MAYLIECRYNDFALVSFSHGLNELLYNGSTYTLVKTNGDRYISSSREICRISVVHCFIIIECSPYITSLFTCCVYTVVLF